MSEQLLPDTPKVKHVPDKMIPSWMKKERTRILTETVPEPDFDKNNSVVGSCVFYWMQRDIRSVDNWALLFASYLAQHWSVPLRVVYSLPPQPPSLNNASKKRNANNDGNNPSSLPPALIDMSMTKRHGRFLLGGLELVYEELRSKNIPLHVVQPKSHSVVGETVCETVFGPHHAVAVVCDFSPLRHARQWMECQAAPILTQANVPMYQVDAHNVVPVWIASNKREVGARTLRPRIHRVVEGYLDDYPELPANKKDVNLICCNFDRHLYEMFLRMDESVQPPDSWDATPGTDAAMRTYSSFVQNGLKQYDELRNDPNHKHICSNLSHWLNHGHVSFQTIVMNVQRLNKFANGTKAFIEEGLVRKELSDNFLFYTPNDYDSLKAAAGWAQQTLQAHANDPREWRYSLSELENGQTHDDLWNAAQLQVVREGQMHGFLRMYWAKKILEWTELPLVALRTAQYFNDKYALDGRDPNGFIGVGWSIMGIHDQGWKEREVFGKIRYMNYKGCQRKFNVTGFVAKYKGASENAVQAVTRHRQRQVDPKRTSVSNISKTAKAKSSTGTTSTLGKAAKIGPNPTKKRKT